MGGGRFGEGGLRRWRRWGLGGGGGRVGLRGCEGDSVSVIYCICVYLVIDWWFGRYPLKIRPKQICCFDWYNLLYVAVRQKIDKLEKEKEKRKEGKKEECIIRESNTGLIDGNDEFYH